jgi:predicted XRE-type DNA-binding protein
VKIKKVEANNRKKLFNVTIGDKEYSFPFSQLTLQPSSKNPIFDLYIDKEIASQGFTYKLKSGEEDTVHQDHVLFYNEDPEYMRTYWLGQLTLILQEKLDESSISKRTFAELLGTSTSQLTRLLDQTNQKKSIDQLIRGLCLLGYRVDFSVREKEAA